MENLDIPKINAFDKDENFISDICQSEADVTSLYKKACFLVVNCQITSHPLLTLVQLCPIFIKSIGCPLLVDCVNFPHLHIKNTLFTSKLYKKYRKISQTNPLNHKTKLKHFVLEIPTAWLLPPLPYHLYLLDY